MRLARLGQKGFTMTELMISMTILAIGILAVGHMQIVALQGTRAARRFATAANLAKQPLEAFKVPGLFLWSSGESTFANIDDDYWNYTEDNDSDSDFAPDIQRDDDIDDLLSTYKYDTLYVMEENKDTNKFDDVCGAGILIYPATCDTISDYDDELGPDGYVRVVNIRNFPAGMYNATPAEDSVNPVYKELNVIVMWKERNWTRSINLRGLVARKDYDFF